MSTVLILGALVGAIMGLTGSGGGILAVPALVLSLDWTIAQAMPVALVAVAISASIGALDGLRKKQARYRAAILMALVGIPFSAVGVQLGQVFSQRALNLVFAVLMLMIAVRQFRAVRAEEALPGMHTDTALCHVDQNTGRLVWTWKTGAVVSAIGATTGMFTGLLGVGGAFIMVPMLRRVTDISMQGVIATVLLVMAMVSTGGIIMAAWHGVEVPMEVTVPFAAAGMVVGRMFVHRISTRYLQYGFTALVVVVGLAMGVRGLLG
ncbi:MAG TPA: sulfite exporter TauE/SafE family protein [Rhodocyclaceae bacterium]|nr:sulfite exporter TauE/SafE family protein [Rhodocyclaceae bacterium]